MELKNGHMIRPFKTVHAVESQGYLVYKRRNKLKAEFHGASQSEIVAAKKREEAVTDATEVRIRLALWMPPLSGLGQCCRISYHKACEGTYSHNPQCSLGW